MTLSSEFPSELEHAATLLYITLCVRSLVLVAQVCYAIGIAGSCILIELLPLPANQHLEVDLMK